MDCKLFMRHYLGQKPDSPDTGKKAGWTASPDIIPYGRLTDPEPKVEDLISQAGYMNAFKSDIYSLESNRVYVRGMNTNTTKINVRVWLFYVYSDVLLWPNNWKYSDIYVETNLQNHVMVSAEKEGDIVVGKSPFIWKPPALPPNNPHYCLVTIVETPPLSDPPLPPLPGYMGSWDGLSQYIITHPEIAWRNVYYVSTEAPQWESPNPITGPPEAGMVWLGLKWENMPIGSAYQVYAKGPGPDHENDLNVAKTEITNTSGKFTVPLNWPENFSTIAYLSYFKNKAKTDPQIGAKISVCGDIPESRLLKSYPELKRKLRLKKDIRSESSMRSFVYNSNEIRDGFWEKVYTIGSKIAEFR